MKASELIGSQVLALGSAEMCGTVCGVCVSDDLKRVRALEVFMNDEDDCERKYLETSRIVATADGVVTVRQTGDLVMSYPAYAHSPVNLPAYSERGEAYGRITDMETNEKFAVTAIVAGERTFAPSNVLSRSDELVVFRLPGSKTKVTRRAKRVPKAPPRVATDNVKITELRRYAFLCGRSLSADVRDPGGAPVAEKGAVVTDELIDLARRRGAIVRLAMAAM